MTTTVQDLITQETALRSHADELAHRFEALDQFDAAALWHADAAATIRLLERHKADLEAYRASEIEASRQAADARSRLSFLDKLTSSRSEEKEHRLGVSKAEKAAAWVDFMVARLKDLMDRIPSSKGAQKAMLSQLRLLKKELATEKRSVNEAMRQIRTRARQNVTSWTGVRGRGVVATVARVERAQIRRSKETALAPYEGRKAALEQRLIETEKRINWVLKFGGSDPSPVPAAIRCAYCGRRVAPDSVCPGCGSDRTASDL